MAGGESAAELATRNHATPTNVRRPDTTHAKAGLTGYVAAGAREMQYQT